MSEARPAPRPSLDPLIRVVVSLAERDAALLEALAAEGFHVENTTPDAIERVARSVSAEAIIVDADREGALVAVGRVRRSEGVVSTVPVVLIGQPGVALRTSLDAVEAGGDAFLPRPLSGEQLTRRLRTLLELPGAGGAVRHVPPAALDALPPSLAPSPIASADPPTLEEPVTGRPRSSGPPALSAALADVLRAAALRAGGTEGELALPSFDEDAIDELIPPELLEPLDAPLESLSDESLPGVLSTSPHTPPPYSVPPGGPRRAPSRPTMSAVGSGGAVPRTIPPTPTITPLAVGGEMRLSGSLERHGVGTVLGAASRSRASGLVVVRWRSDEYQLSLTSGHLLCVRSSRAGDECGALLARLGLIPREAARFAAVPLDAGVRGAALLAARGYLTAAALAQALARAAREVVFDLLALEGIEWEMRPLETAAEIPLAPRALDALLVLGARARIEPGEARAALGGDEAIVSVRPEPAQLSQLPLARAERDAVEFARGRTLRAIVENAGEGTLPAMLAMAWLGLLRIDGAAAGADVTSGPPTSLAEERTRVRALGEAAHARDYFALLGVSEWATRAASLEALDARRTELAGLRVRHPEVPALGGEVTVAFEELAQLLADEPGWGRYTTALRAR